MVTYKVLTRTLLGLQGVFPIYYLAGIDKSEVYNEIVLFEADGCFYIWKELNFRQLFTSLSELSEEAFKSIVKGYQKMNTAAPQEKNRYRYIIYESFVGAGYSIPLQICKAIRLSLKTDNEFRRMIEKMLAEQ
ncbi:MAG: hypothetical protein J6T72_03160 [Alphaproteobacteria bacterium]|nr:hypothetical protein [Alphaproteobacteria bacterium]